MVWTASARYNHFLFLIATYYSLSRALDDVVSSLTTGPRVEEAMHRTLRWIDRCIAAHKHPETQVGGTRICVLRNIDFQVFSLMNIISKYEI